MKYRTSFYTLSDGHTEKEIEAADRPALMAQLDKEMIDLSAPYTIYEIQGEKKPMTTPTPTPQQAAEAFREEIRNAFDLLHIEIAEIRADLAQMREGLTHAATPAPTATNAPTMVIPMTRLIKTRTNGKNYFKMQGGQYVKRGITVWDEILKVLDLDPATIEWDAQDAHTFKTPLNVTVLMQEYTDSESGEIKSGPQKVIGKA